MPTAGTLCLMIPTSFNKLWIPPTNAHDQNMSHSNISLLPQNQAHKWNGELWRLIGNQYAIQTLRVRFYPCLRIWSRVWYVACIAETTIAQVQVDPMVMQTRPFGLRLMTESRIIQEALAIALEIGILITIELASPQTYMYPCRRGIQFNLGHIIFRTTDYLGRSEVVFVYQPWETLGKVCVFFYSSPRFVCWSGFDRA